MRRKNVIRTLIIVVVIAWSVIALLPTLQLSQQKEKAEQYYQTIQENTRLSKDDTKAALASGNLEREVRNRFTATNGNTVDDLMDDVRRLTTLYQKIAENEGEAIKLGLDLQGGTYLVYEVDLPQLLTNLAKQKDSDFERLLETVVERVQQTNEDFFEVLQNVFESEDVRLSRYFGAVRDSNDEVISYLQDQARDAVTRTLEVLRNRIDQFGVSEPSITRQGDRRIVVELAGIQDVSRAKNIIGTTALLEFQMEREPEVTSAVRDEINRVMKTQLKQGADMMTDAGADSAEGGQRVRRDTERSVDDIFGGAAVLDDPEATAADTSDTDSTVLVDEGVFQDRPFDGLLANLGGDIGVPTKNIRTVERILNSPEVQKVIPNDSEFLFTAKPDMIGENEYYRLFLLKKEPELLGSMVSTAQVQIGTQMTAGEPVVQMELNNEGAKIFSKVTGANIGKRMAIVLDGKIVSIPVIQDKIPTGNAVIEGMANIEEAKDLAIILRAGALPAPIQAIEERTVGPSLGQDSIRQGTTSMLVGMALVIIFMVIYYRLSGIVANVALLLNILIIMAVLAYFHATLTLPGVAGIILTIGMAVDANVLIFERIREELRGGKTIRAAIDSGYGRAFTTILDANVTTLLTALVLYQFGTGPIRGFALTLSIGIVVSMFTAIVVTRVIFDYFTNRFTLKTLSI